MYLVDHKISTIISRQANRTSKQMHETNNPKILHSFNKTLIKKVIKVLTPTVDKQTSNFFHKTCIDEKFSPSFAWAELCGVDGYRCKLVTKLSM